MFTSRYKPFFNRLIEPLARALAASGISPNTLTLATPLLCLIVCWCFITTRAVVLFCLLMTAVVCLDWLDGAVARVSGRTSRFGGYLDAMADRYVDVMIVIAIADVSGYWLLSMLVLAGTLLVSYAKARASMEAPIANLEWPDLMERSERGVVVLLGLLAWRLLPWRPLGRDLLWWALALLAALTHVTVLQRILRARRFIRDRG